MIKIKTLLNFFLIGFSSIFIALANKDDRYWLMWLLPIIYAFLLIIIEKNTGKRSNEIGYRSIKIVMLFRYVLTPLSIVASQYYTGPGPEPNKSTMTFAILLMMYELTVVGFTICLYSIKNKSDVLMHDNHTKNEKNNFLWLFLIAAFIVISLIDIRLIIPNNLITISSDVERISLDFEGNGLIIILRNVFRVIFGMSMLNFINRLKTSDNAKIILSLGSIIIILGLYTSNARWDTLSISFVGIILLNNLYPKYSKTINIFIGSIMLIALTSVTIYKFLGYTTISISESISIIKEMIELVSRQFQVYFSGPRNVALAIDMEKSIDANFGWLINDLFASLPGLSNYFNQNIRFNLLFNRYIYSGNVVSQIIPLVGIGYNSLGFIFSPIITSGFVILTLKLNDEYKKRDKIFDRYLLIYMIIYTSMCMGMSIQILTNKYYAVFIPSILTLLASRVIKKLFSKKSFK